VLLKLDTIFPLASTTSTGGIPTENPPTELNLSAAIYIFPKYSNYLSGLNK
jgi:hypothetical protein